MWKKGRDRWHGEEEIKRARAGYKIEAEHRRGKIEIAGIKFYSCHFSRSYAFLKEDTEMVRSLKCLNYLNYIYNDRVPTIDPIKCSFYASSIKLERRIS